MIRREQNPDAADQRPYLLDDHIYPARGDEAPGVREWSRRLPWKARPVVLPRWVLWIVRSLVVLGLLALLVYALSFGGPFNVFGR